MASCNGLPFLLNMIHIYRSAFSKYSLTVKYAKAQEKFSLKLFLRRKKIKDFQMVTKLKLCALQT